MSFFCVKIYYGPTATFHRVVHRPQLLSGLRDRLQKLGFRVDLAPVPFRDYCMLEMCGYEVFRCNAQHLRFNTAAERDPVCQKAVDAVLYASAKCWYARNYLWVDDIILQQTFKRNPYGPIDFFPIPDVQDGEDIPPVKCIIKECCDIYEKEGKLPPIECIISKCCDISRKKNIKIPPIECIISKCCHIPGIKDSDLPTIECLKSKCCHIPGIRDSDIPPIECLKSKCCHIPGIKDSALPPIECLKSKCCHIAGIDSDLPPIECLKSKCCHIPGIRDSDLPPIECLQSKCCHLPDIKDSDLPPRECIKSKCCDITNKKDELPPFECSKTYCCDVPNKKDYRPPSVKVTNKVSQPAPTKVGQIESGNPKKAAESAPPTECVISKCCDNKDTQVPPSDCITSKCCDISNK